MTRCSVAIPLLALALIPATGVSKASASPLQSTSRKDAKKTADSLTGCVDERDGRYVLTDDRELSPIANLEADGFPQEGFAKHLGHKVTVRGTSTPGDPRPTFKVRSIATVSETCGQRQ